MPDVRAISRLADACLVAQEPVASSRRIQPIAPPASAPMAAALNTIGRVRVMGVSALGPHYAVSDMRS